MVYIEVASMVESMVVWLVEKMVELKAICLAGTLVDYWVDMMDVWQAARMVLTLAA